MLSRGRSCKPVERAKAGQSRWCCDDPKPGETNRPVARALGSLRRPVAFDAASLRFSTGTATDRTRGISLHARKKGTSSSDRVSAHTCGCATGQTTGGYGSSQRKNLRRCWWRSRRKLSETVRPMRRRTRSKLSVYDRLERMPDHSVVQMRRQLVDEEVCEHDDLSRIQRRQCPEQLHRAMPMCVSLSTFGSLMPVSFGASVAKRLTKDGPGSRPASRTIARSRTEC